MIGVGAGAAFVCVLLVTATPARAACDPDGLQASGSIYRICMPPEGQYNGHLVIWAHGFQDATEPVGIPEDQLCFGGVCLPELINQLGFGFATTSYSKTGLAVVQGKADVLDLVDIFAAAKGVPRKVYLVGASEGGIITTLALEQHPDVFSAGLAACGPIGSFPHQINYFGDARATFNYFFPGIIPSPPFAPDPALVAAWDSYYEVVVKPAILSPGNRARLNQWVRVAQLPHDADNYLATVEVAAADVLRYAVVNLNDAAATLGGFPYDNQRRWFSGSDNDFLLNLFVPRVSADPAALAAMRTAYETTGVLQRPLVTLHTLRDQQVPYWHEVLYSLKTWASGSLLTRHFNVTIDRFEHCNFTPEEALVAFLIMLVYDGVVQEVTGTAPQLSAAELARFERLAQLAGVPYRRDGGALRLTLKSGIPD
jgi:pimeloyl-ACP methyl ester carboxylesterase